jgi:hypothetical protein
VSESEPPARGPGRRTGGLAPSRSALLGLSLLGALLVSGGVGLLYRARASPGPTPARTAAEPEVASASPLLPPPKAADPASPPAMTAPAEVRAASGSSSTAPSSSAPSPAVLAVPSARAPAAGADAARAPRAPRAPSLAATAPAPSSGAPKPNCSPPYVIDSMGDRQYKPECL